MNKSKINVNKLKKGDSVSSLPKYKTYLIYEYSVLTHMPFESV